MLEESRSRLHLVKNMFVEFHLTRGDSTNRLQDTLNLLDECGFDYLITSTLWYRHNASIAPLKVCGPVSSISIFARRVG